jgi:biopolymer transport protein TolR
VPVDLPKTSAQQVGGKDEPLVVSVNSKDEVFLGETKYELAELATKLKAVHEEKPDQRVFIRGDKAINYGRMMEVMGVVIDSGFRQLGLLGEQAGGAAPAPAGAGKPATPAPAPRR